jgi:uncharacterized membrane protein
MEYLLLLSSFIWFGIGYLLGSRVTIKEIKDKAAEVIKDIKKSTVPSGVVTRPTAQQVNKSQDKQALEEEEEMRRNLETMFPDYKKNKKVN